MTRIVVVGDLMTDAVARADIALVKGSDTPSTVTMHGGGSGANIAAWLAVSGAETSFVGRRGTEPTGRTRDMELMGYGVDARMVMDNDRPTGSCVVMVTHKGDLTLLSDPGANAALRSEDLPRDVFVPAAHLHLSGYTLIREESRSAARAALELAGQQRMSVSVDAASFAPLQRIGADIFLDNTTEADLCLVNEEEAIELTGCDDMDAAARHLTERYPEVVVKLGPGGALWVTKGKETPVRADADAVSSTTDATGAGDAFCAGFLPPWLAGQSPGDALASGCRLASEALHQLGGRPVT